MTEILLQTKLFVPQTRPYLVPRPRLIKKIDSGINGRITLISAPAGFGKTTLMTAWLEETKHKTAWYSLDEYDNDTDRFLRYFIAAWQTINPACGQDAQTLLQSEAIGTTPQPPELILTTLLNDITQRAEEAILVIDDFHLIANEALLNAMNFWIDHAPPNIHTVIISRTNPPLSLAKWRVRGQLNEINSADLQFSTTEAADFLRQVMRLDLATEDIRLLAEKTEGWIASLQLVALSLQGTTDPHNAVTQFTGSDRQMMAYLLEEVWQKQTAEVQKFLQQTAVFHRFNVPLCTAVTDFKNSRQLIDQLDQNNLFLRSLDNQQNWYCYHPIFTEFLQKRQKETNPEQFQQLHKKASQWFAQEGLAEEAIQHAISAQLYDTAAQYILDQANETIWQQNRSQMLHHWTHQLPEKSLYALPELTAYAAWAYILHGKSGELNLFLDKAEYFWATHHIEVPNHVHGEIAILRGEMSLAYGRFEESINHFAQAETQITPRNRRLYTALLQVQGFAYRINGDVDKAKAKLAEARTLAQRNQENSIGVFASYDYGKTCMMAGQLTEAEQVFREVIAQTPPEKYISNSTYSFVYGALGELLLYRNRLTAAHEHVEKSLELGLLTSDNNPMVRQGKLTLALIKQAQGNWATSQTLLAEAMELAQAFPNDRTTTLTVSINALAYLLQGDPEPVRDWLENRFALLPLPRQSDSIPKYQYHEEQIILARFLLLDAPHKAIDYLRLLHETAVSHKWHHNLLQINILLALAHQKNNDVDIALNALSDALEFAAHEGYIYPFVREGSPMAQLLRLALLRGIAPDAIGRIQAAFMPTAVSAQPLIDPLTERELEILNLMANGRTNPEIARKLFIATGTVAKYSNTIYAKLAVRNRTEATNRAKDLGLIE